ncbi:hypothetical protein [Peribacillus muralis]|uniref:hypothetical protein n=1 Tax=Peribacillus muralis TaxID=264697 RepID=UPI003D03576C
MPIQQGQFCMLLLKKFYSLTIIHTERVEFHRYELDKYEKALLEHINQFYPQKTPIINNIKTKPFKGR